MTGLGTLNTAHIIKIGGLPFTVSTRAQYSSPGSMGHWANVNLPHASSHMNVSALNSGNYMYAQSGINDATNAGWPTIAELTALGLIVFSCSYEVD